MQIIIAFVFIALIVMLLIQSIKESGSKNSFSNSQKCLKSSRPRSSSNYRNYNPYHDSSYAAAAASSQSYDSGSSYSSDCGSSYSSDGGGSYSSDCGTSGGGDCGGDCGGF